MAQYHIDEGDFSTEAFKKDYEKYGANDLKTQIPHLEKLANLYVKRANTTADSEKRWMHYVQAHALINACLARDGDVNKWHCKRYDIENEYYSDYLPLVMKPDEHLAKTEKLKAQLTSLRCDVSIRLSPVTKKIKALDIDNESSPENMEILELLKDESFSASEYCTEKMKQLCAEVMKMSELVVGSPPCAYAAVALGSMARGEATPYSDLEYLFIVESSEYKDYFSKLAIDSYLRISNFCETPLKCMYYPEIHDNYGTSDERNWFTDNAMNGFKIDGFTPRAGNVPTGNPAKGKYLIKTAEELADMHRTALHSKQFITGEADLLSSTAMFHWYGKGEELYNTFTKLRNQHSREESEEKTKNQRSNLLNDMNSYEFVPNFSSALIQKRDKRTGYFYCDFKNRKAKVDIYRSPSLLIRNLGFLYNCESHTTRNVLHELHNFVNQSANTEKVLLDEQIKNGVFSLELLDNLTLLMATALYVRMAAYLAFNSQKEELSFLTQSETTSQDKYYYPRELFVIAAVNMNKLKSSIEYENDQFRKAEALFFCEDYARCLTELTQALDLSSLEASSAVLSRISKLSIAAKVCLMIAQSLRETANFAMSNSYYKKMLESETNQGVICWFNLCIGNNCDSMAQYNTAQEHYDSALSILTAENTPEEIFQRYIDCVHYALGNIYVRLDEYNSAEMHYKESLTMAKKLYGPNSNDLNIAAALYGLGRICAATSKYEQAIQYYEKALAMYQSIHGKSSNHPALSATHFGLGCVYNATSSYQEALKHLQFALRMERAVRESVIDHPVYANIVLHLGCTWFYLGEYDRAAKLLVQALSLVSTDTDHSNTALAHHCLGSTYHKQNKCDLAIDHLSRSLDINRRIHGPMSSRPEIADTLQRLGTAYVKIDKYDLAEKNYKSSLKMMRSILGDSADDLGIASTLHGLGTLYGNLGQYELADGYLKEALHMSVRLYGDDSCHPSLAATHHALGQLYEMQGRLHESLAEVLKAVAMIEHKFGYVNPHPSLAEYKETQVWVIQFILLRDYGVNLGKLTNIIHKQ